MQNHFKDICESVQQVLEILPFVRPASWRKSYIKFQSHNCIVKEEKMEKIHRLQVEPEVLAYPPFSKGQQTPD